MYLGIHGEPYHKENAPELFKEVLNYYAFLKNKKEQEAKKPWESMESPIISKRAAPTR
jgi:hypothetical protein